MAILTLQCGELGPFSQATAGIDIALWDIAAQRAGQPLWRLLGGREPTVGVYASGINPDEAVTVARRMRDRGHRAFKLKIGFAPDVDIANLTSLREALGPVATLAVDANQAWTLTEASVRVPEIRRFDLAWLEEPLRADRPLGEWRKLAELACIPLAGGENLTGIDEFDRAIKARGLTVVQPDLAKWGGFSGTLKVGRAVRDAGLRFCPHYLGGGIGLLASAHLLAATGGDGLLEIDSNENPLRDDLCGDVRAVMNARITLGSAPGLGSTPDLVPFERFRVRH
jgi:D-galactarolactone cycloisomerase